MYSWDISIYPLVNQHSELENHHLSSLIGKTSISMGHVPVRKLLV